MKFIKKPAAKFELGFCNVCKDNCHNDCGKQKGCGYCSSYSNDQSASLLRKECYS